jgi:hypothetical protein
MNYESLSLPTLVEIAIQRQMYSASRLRNKAAIVTELERDDRATIAREEARRNAEAKEATHRQTRQLDLRRQEEVEAHVGSLEYPFSFLRSGEYPRQCNPLPGQPEEEIGTFPDNIAEYIWIRPGENDEQPWLTLCRLDTGVYVYYRGECDYTGFDCQGDMKIYASKDPNILLLYAMTSMDYDAYVAETTPLK